MPTAAIVGCGDVSIVHAEAIEAIAGIDLVGVCDVDAAARTAASAAHGVPGFASHMELIERLHPDVVHVTTPHHQHADVAIACLEAGINVVLEKPLAHTVAEGQRVVAAVERGSAKIAVCFQNRYNATAQAVRSLLDSGELGAVLGGSATVMWQRTADYYRAKPWRSRWETSGGGVLINQAIHTLDMLQWFVGDVVEVRGHAATHVFGDTIEVEDTAEMVLTHDSGVRSAFYATLANPFTAPVTVEVLTEQALLTIRKDLTISYADGQVEVVPERAAASVGRAYWGVSHELLIRDFYARLDEPEPFWISPREAAKTLRILGEVYAQSYPATNRGLDHVQLR